MVPPKLSATQSQRPVLTPFQETGVSSEGTRAKSQSDSESFADVLEGMRGDADCHDEEESNWFRPPLSNLDQQKHITFQNVDIRESNRPSGRSEIHLFGVTKAGQSILARVIGFEHYFYYPAPQGISDDDLDPLRDYLNGCFDKFAVSGIELDNQCSSSNFERPVPFLKVYLFDHRQIDCFLTSGSCAFRSLFSLPERSYEAKIPYFLRFMLDNEVKAMDWLQIPAKKYKRVEPEYAVSLCQLEVVVDYRQRDSILICDTLTGNNREKFAPLRILSFDLECEVRSDGQFPDAQYQGVIQIGSMISIYGQETPFSRVIFTLGTCAAIAGAQVFSFDNEAEMLMAWRRFFIGVDPDLVTGYNITQFDIPYLLNRARALRLQTFPFLGRIKVSSQHLTKSRTNFLDCPGYDGRLLLDVYFHIRENHPGLPGQGAYKLNAISARFLGDKKEDVGYTQIPVLQAGNANTRRELALYCLKDVFLPLRLMVHLKCFEKEVKEAKGLHVPYNTLRVHRPLKDTARRYLDAIARGYILADFS